MAAPELQRNALIGLAVSISLASCKLAAGVIGHSSALVADAVESFADCFGSIIVWKALRVADNPPDERHPYGYGKAEALGALAVGVMLLAAAVVIAIQAVHEIMVPHSAPAAWTLWVLIAVIFVKEWLFRRVLSAADRTGSDAARADAWHHRSDAVTSAAALVGVSIAVWGPRWFGTSRLVLADEVAALIATVIIVLTGVRLIRPALAELLDAAAAPLAARVRETARAIEGVVLVEKLHARKSGRGYHVDMHLHVDPQLDVLTAHRLSGKVRAAVRVAHPQVRDVLIHIEPAEAAAPSAFKAPGPAGNAPGG
jgi:cation diffusion facilitator family transporter